MGQEVKTVQTVTHLRIYLVSRMTIQSRVLQDLLFRELGANCVLHENVSACLDAALLSDTETIVLFDCSVVRPGEAVERLHAMGNRPVRITPAFLNLEPQHSIEHDAVRAGIRGLFYTHDEPAQFVRGVRAIADGEVWISRRVLLNAALQSAGPSSPRENGRAELTQRETEILALIIVGARNEEIAEKLYISTNTVKTHIYNIYKKIHVPNRTQAALWAAKHL